MASPRRQGREVALQVLCALEANPAMEARSALGLYVSHLAGGDDEEESLPGPGSPGFDHAFTESLVAAAVEHKDEIDRAITSVSRSWRIDRMARVDRNILRMAVAELKFLPDIPARVTINEAVELAKRFGAAESAPFVNGLLDSVLKSLDLRK